MKIVDIFRKKTNAPDNLTLTRGYVINKRTAFATTEEYKMLRTAITFAASIDAHKGKIIGTTSSHPGEGKSITCTNLAITFALTDAKVVLVDCDLRNPSLSKYLGERGAPGISNVIAEFCDIREAICRVERCGVEFDLIPAGDIPPNPSELLGSKRMESLLDALSNAYDYVFIDLPPALIVTDALVLAKRLSGLVLVVRSGQAKRDNVASTLERMKQAEVNILGFILNGVGQSAGRKYGNKHYGYGRAPSSG